MKYLVTAIAFVVGMQAHSVFAQSAASAVCEEYSAMDNAGRMAMVAELESMNSEMASSQEMSSAEIQAALDANCTTTPDILIAEASKDLHK